MRVLLDIKESKALFFMGLFRNFSFVKARPITVERTFSFQEVGKEADAVVKKKTSLQKKMHKKIFLLKFLVFGQIGILTTEH